jgi:hypothetical protein
MPLQFTTPRRSTVNKRRRHINHRKPTTIREKMIVGLQAMGFEKVPSRTSKYDVFSHGDQNWYVGSNGALRIGASVGASHAAGPITKDLILTAPVVRPLVRNWLDAHQQDIVPAEGTYTLIQKILQDHSNLAEVSPRVVLNHINTWLKEQGYLVKQGEME